MNLTRLLFVGTGINITYNIYINAIIYNNSVLCNIVMLCNLKLWEKTNIYLLYMIEHVRFNRTITPTICMKHVRLRQSVTIHLLICIFCYKSDLLFYNMTLLKYLLSNGKPHCNILLHNSHYRGQSVLFCNNYYSFIIIK